VNGDVTGEGSRGWDVLKRGKAGRFAYDKQNASLPLGGTNGKIVPFVCDLTETRCEIVSFSHEDYIHSWVEAVFELTLIAAGVAGIVAGVVAT
jgi:hypothetical protein